MAKSRKPPEPSPLPPVHRTEPSPQAPPDAPYQMISDEEKSSQASRAEIHEPPTHTMPTGVPYHPHKKNSLQMDPGLRRDDISRFWSGAGLVFGIWVLAGFVGFMTLVLLSKDPPKLEPPLDRALVEKTLGALLNEIKPAAERYTKISREIQAMLDSKRLTDEPLRKELTEALAFAKQVSVPKEYWLTPIWVEGVHQDFRQVVPVFRLEALNDATTPGSRAELPQSTTQASSQPSWQKISFGAVKNISATWAAGDPLRLRFSLRDAEGLRPTVTIGGDDLELAPDAPLPGAAMLLLGEARALTRGQGRYLVRVRTKEGAVLVPPLILLRALKEE